MSRRLSDWIEGFMAFTKNLETPHRYREWTAVSVIASALQRKCFSEWGSETFYPNMYIVLVGPSGIRKGTAMRPGKVLLRRMGVHLAAESTTREALIGSMSKVVEEGALNIGTDRHCSITIYSSELTVFLGYSNSQLIIDLTSWYDCEDIWTYETKSRGEEKIAGVWVNLLGATTPQAIREALPPGAIGGGLTSRMIFVYEEDLVEPRPFPFETDEAESLGNDLVHDLSNIIQMNGKFLFTPDFFHSWGEWYVDQYYHPPFQDPNFEGYNRRRGMLLHKLCMICSASIREDMIIDAKVFNKALDLLNRVEAGMTRTFSGYGQSASGEITKKLMRFITQNESTTEQDLLKNFFGDISDRSHLYKLLEVLKRMGYCTIEGTNIKVNKNFREQS